MKMNKKIFTALVVVAILLVGNMKNKENNLLKIVSITENGELITLK